MAGYAIPGGGLVLNKKFKIQNLILGGGSLKVIFLCCWFTTRINCHIKPYYHGRSALEILVNYTITLLTSEGLASSNALSLSMSSACVCLVFLWILSMVSWSLPITLARASVRSVNVWICTVGAKVD